MNPRALLHSTQDDMMKFNASLWFARSRELLLPDCSRREWNRLARDGGRL